MRNSVVDVQLLDLTKVRTDAIEFANHVSKFTVNQVRSEEWGVVQTTEGVYGISRDGFGSQEPITEDNPLVIDLWCERVVTDDIGRPVVFGSPIPQCHATLNDEEVLKLKNGAKENLSTFIESSEPVHQYNFHVWNDFIKQKFHWDLGELECLKNFDN